VLNRKNREMRSSKTQPSFERRKSANEWLVAAILPLPGLAMMSRGRLKVKVKPRRSHTID
jgi:hypothetical protein